MRVLFKLMVLANLGVLGIAPALGEPRNYDAQYRAYGAGLPLADMYLHIETSENGDYRLSVAMRTAGVARLFANGGAVSTTNVTFENGEYVPQGLTGRWQMDDEVRQTQLKYENGAPVYFKSDYVPEPEQMPVTEVVLEDVGRGTLNPFLALLAPMQSGLLADACYGEKRLFDGRRLAKLNVQKRQLLSPSEHTLALKQPVAECAVMWQPIAGYSQRTLDRAVDMKPLQFFFASIGDSGFAAPAKIVANTRFGNMKIVATRFFAPTTKPAPPLDIEKALAD